MKKNLIFILLKATNESEIKENETANNDYTDDFDKQLKEELDELKSSDDDYKIIDAGAKYTLFVTAKKVNVNKTSEKIYEYIRDTKKPVCRFLQRFVPVIRTCKAFNEDIEKCIEQTFNLQYDSSVAIKYTCIYKSSNNSTLKRDDIIKIVNKYFQAKNSNNKVEYDAPDYVILVQVIRNMCFISFLKEYFNYRKYNLVEMGIKYSSESSVACDKQIINIAKEDEIDHDENLIDTSIKNSSELNTNSESNEVKVVNEEVR